MGNLTAVQSLSVNSSIIRLYLKWIDALHTVGMSHSLRKPYKSFKRRQSHLHTIHKENYQLNVAFVMLSQFHVYGKKNKRKSPSDMFATVISCLHSDEVLTRAFDGFSKVFFSISCKKSRLLKKCQRSGAKSNR